MNLEQLGWSAFFAATCQEYLVPGHTIGRVVYTVHGKSFIFTPSGETWATLSGKLRDRAIETPISPVVGDWVILNPNNVIETILPRQSQLSRQASGQVTQEQVIAANINTVFLVCGLDGDFNLRRIERYLLAIWESGANPVILLNKADLCSDWETCQSQVEAIAFSVPIKTLSAAYHQGLDQLNPYLKTGQTIAVVGSSGVGKSTLINQLLGQNRQTVRAVRGGDSRGRHTTTHRELIPLPTGGLLIDTPGMRELQIWQAETGFSQTFADIEALAQECRFRDCQHDTEPGCAVKQAIEEKRLSKKRWRNYQKLQGEIHYSHTRQDHKAKLEEKQKWKRIHKALRQHPKYR